MARPQRPRMEGNSHDRIGWFVAAGFFRRARARTACLAEAAGLLAFMGMFACLPVDWASAFGAWIGRTIGPRLGLSRRALGNLGIAFPDNDERQNQRILRGMWDNLGRTVAEFPHLSRICAGTSGRVEIINGEGLGALEAQGRPMVLFGCHLANWEVGSTMIHRLMGQSLLSVYRASNNPYVQWLLRRHLRSRRAVAKGAEGGRDLVRHLLKGGHVGMLVDQKLNDGITVPFFGRDAMTAPAIARLALKFKCPMVPVLVERIRGARFRFTVMPSLDAADTGAGAADVLKTMTRINGVVESWIRARPEQWLWIHRRWGTEPGSR